MCPIWYNVLYNVFCLKKFAPIIYAKYYNLCFKMNCVFEETTCALHNWCNHVMTLFVISSCLFFKALKTERIDNWYIWEIQFKFSNSSCIFSVTGICYRFNCMLIIKENTILLYHVQRFFYHWFCFQLLILISAMLIWNTQYYQEYVNPLNFFMNFVLNVLFK